MWKTLLGTVLVTGLAVLANLAKILEFLEKKGKTFATFFTFVWANITPLALTAAMLVLAWYVLRMRSRVEELADQHDTLLRDAISAHVITEQRLTSEGLLKRIGGEDPDVFIDLGNGSQFQITTHTRSAIDKATAKEKNLLRSKYPGMWEWYEKGPKS